MTEQRERELIRRAIDQRFSGMQANPRLADRIIQIDRGEIKVKKKLSLAFIVVIISILIAATALAAALLWKDQYVPMKEIEKKEGYYDGWPILQKQHLVQALIESGHIAESEETGKLFDNRTGEAAKHMIADQLLLSLTSETDVREISIDTITYAVMGFVDTWTPEQRVWWQQVTNQLYGDLGSPDILIVPEEGLLSEAEAIAIAKKAILDTWKYTQDEIDRAVPVANLFVTKQRPDYRRWEVQLKMYKEGSDTEVELIHLIIVDEDGQVIDDPDMGIVNPEESYKRMQSLLNRQKTPLFQTIDGFLHRAGEMPFRTWPLELKAEFSIIVAPQVRAIVDSGDLSPLISGDNPDLSLIASSTFNYGMPDERDINQSDAYDLSVQAIIETYDLDDDIIALYDDVSFYYDISEPDEPLWKFLFLPTFLNKFPGGYSSEQSRLQYKIEINARTGEVVKTEEFKFQLINNNLEYVIKLY